MVFVLVVVGISAGILSSFFGVGGGTIIVPTLYFLFPNIPPTMVIGTSLGVILFGAILNTYFFSRKKMMLPPKKIVSVAMSIIPGTLIGLKITSSLNPDLIKGLLGCFLLFVSFRLVKKANQKVTKAKQGELVIAEKKLMLGTFLGGCISGLTGIGGGAILVPYLITFCGLTLYWIPVVTNTAMMFGTSSAVIKSLFFMPSVDPSLVPIPGMIGQFHGGIVAIMIIGSIIGIQIGIRLKEKVSPKIASYVFAALLVLISLRMFAIIFNLA